MIPDGTYVAKVVGAELGVTSTDKDQIAVQFEVEGNGTITWYGYFTENAMERTIESMEHCGFRGDDVTKLDSMIGNQAQIVIASETWEGKTRARVQWVNKLGGPIVKNEMSMDRKLSFAERMKGNLIARKQMVARSGDLPPEAHMDDDDVPFKV